MPNVNKLEADPSMQTFDIIRRAKPLTGEVPAVILGAQSTASRGGVSTAMQCGCHSGDRWYVVSTPAKSEFIALLALNEAGFRAWLPMIVHRSFVKLKDEPVRESVVPMFPRYLFVSFDTNRDQWRRIFGLRGVAWLFCGANERPIPVRHGVVEAIQALGRAGDGVIDEKATPFPTNGFSPIVPDREVRILSGPLKGFSGICTMADKDRVKVMMTIFGRDGEMEFKRSHVEAAG